MGSFEGGKLRSMPVANSMSHPPTLMYCRSPGWAGFFAALIRMRGSAQSLVSPVLSLPRQFGSLTRLYVTRRCQYLGGGLMR